MPNLPVAIRKRSVALTIVTSALHLSRGPNIISLVSGSLPGDQPPSTKDKWFQCCPPSAWKIVRRMFHREHSTRTCLVVWGAPSQSLDTSTSYLNRKALKSKHSNQQVPADQKLEPVGMERNQQITYSQDP